MNPMVLHTARQNERNVDSDGAKLFPWWEEIIMEWLPLEARMEQASFLQDSDTKKGKSKTR